MRDFWQRHASVRDFGCGRRRLGHHRRLLELGPRPLRHVDRDARGAPGSDGRRRPSRRSARAVPPYVDREAGRHRLALERRRPPPRGRHRRARRALAATGPAARLPRARAARRLAALAAGGHSGPRASRGAADVGVGGAAVRGPVAASWGIGDLDDLARLATWSSSLGAKMLVLNPLHAVAPVHPQQPSPYFPASRLWRNPLALHVESMPGAPLLGDELNRFANVGRGARRTQVDRPRRRVPSQARGVRSALLVVDRSRGTGQPRRVQRVLRRAWQRPSPVRDLLRGSPSGTAAAGRRGHPATTPRRRVVSHASPVSTNPACSCTCGSSGSSTCNSRGGRPRLRPHRRPRRRLRLRRR